MLAGALFGLVLALALNSSAEDTELDSGPRAIPYNGILEYNGQMFHGQADLRFTLTDMPGGEGANCIFTEEHNNITTYTGRFSVNIGSVQGDLPDCVFNSDAMYIKVSVRDAAADEDGDDTNDAYVTLAGQQRIHPVPFSYWSAEGSDFRIDGSASVGSNLTVGNNLTVNGVIQPRTGDNGIAWSGSGDDAWIRYYADGDGEDSALQIGINNDANDDLEFFQGGAVRMSIANDININSNIINT